MKLPKHIWSALGPVPVVVTAALADDREALGLWDWRRRTVLLEPDADPVSKLQTFTHECVHVALTDAGAHNLLSTEMNELVADAVGSWLAAALLSGWLRFGR
jgi:hypothetical protein